MSDIGPRLFRRRTALLFGGMERKRSRPTTKKKGSSQMESTKANAVKSDISLTITRIFDAAPELVFEAWLAPTQLSEWVGPHSLDFRTQTLALEPRVGGRYHIAMHKPNGVANARGVYREIERYTRLVFTWSRQKDCNGSDADGAPMARHETLVTLTFRPHGNQTEMTLLQENFQTADERDGHDKGWNISFGQLAAMLAK
jgi:uncharacterized protein YndB with AHSA1/START domain